MCPEQGLEHQEGTEVKHTVFLWPGTMKNSDIPLIFFFFFKPAIFLPANFIRAGLRTDKTCAYPHTCTQRTSLVISAVRTLMLGVCYNQSVPSPYLSGRTHTTACGVYVRLSVCVSLYVCVQSMKESLVSTVHPSPSLILMSPPFSVSLIQPVHQWPHK